MPRRVPPNERKSRWISSIAAALGAALALATASCGGTVTGSQAGGGTGGGTGTGGTGGGTVTKTIAASCESPVAMKQADGSDTGLVRCQDGSVDRVSAPVCKLVDAQDTCDPSGTYSGDCKTAADCGAHPHGTCNVHSNGYAPAIWCGCDYQCETDADCAPGHACRCGYDGGWPECVPKKGCAVNSDCASGECGRSFYTNGCKFQENFACRGGEDDCRVDGDCGGNGNCSKTTSDGKWKCTDVNCTL